MHYIILLSCYVVVESFYIELVFALKFPTNDRTTPTENDYNNIQSEIGSQFTSTFHRSVVVDVDRIGISSSSSSSSTKRTAFVAEHAGVAPFVAARVDEFSLFTLVERHAAAGTRLFAITSFFEQFPNRGQICKRNNIKNKYTNTIIGLL